MTASPRALTVAPRHSPSLPTTRGPSGSGRRLLLRLAAVALLMFGVLAPLLAFPQPGQTAPTVVPQYKLKIKLDYARGGLFASETLSYQNNTGQALDSLVFNVVPAYFNSFQLHACEVDGKTVSASLTGSILEVPLGRTLKPGEKSQVDMTFTVTVPRPGNLRFGRGPDSIALGNWFPILAVYQSDPSKPGGAGWRRDQYVDTGDAFYSECADFDVEVEADADLVIGHTGKTIAQQGNHWSFRARMVRDFALTFSKRYRLLSGEVGSTTVIALYLPEHASAGKQYLDSALALLRWGNERLGTYPYDTLILAETDSNDPGWSGQEFPNLIMISSLSSADGGGRGSYMDYLVAHETLHQWFYALVGNDQINEPWLDEGLATYLSYLYLKDTTPAVFAGYWQRAQSRYDATRNIGAYRPLNSSVYDFADESDYFAMVYSQGAIFLDQMRESMGSTEFFLMLQRVVQEYAYGVVTGADFLRLAQAGTKGDLRVLVEKYFRNATDLLKQAQPTATPTIPSTPQAQAAGTATSTVGTGLAGSQTGTPTAAGGGQSGNAQAGNQTRGATVAGLQLPSPYDWWWALLPVGALLILVPLLIVVRPRR